MNGTCIETPPQKIPGEDEPYVFSFFTDISTNPEVIELVQTIQSNMKSTLTCLTRYLTRWKKYRGIWKVDKVTLLFTQDVPARWIGQGCIFYYEWQLSPF